MEPITMSARVAALIPHFRCEQWLSTCLESLLEGTRPLDAIIVLDDASERPPVDIVARYPDVTLYRAERNVGPYRLIQQAIDDLDFDAYLFQDADDWSSPLRLERLLAAAERTGAHMVGSYEVRVLVDERDVERVRYPTDVNASLREHPQGFPLLHPTSLVARSLLERLGGFASGMRFSGDAELLRRAGHVGRIVNVPEYLYFRRKRSGALTTSSETGLGAPAREAVQRELRERARRNAERVAAGEAPDLAPWRVAPPVALELLAGPDPARGGGGEAPPSRVYVFESPERSYAPASDTAGEEPPPVFIVGPPRSGVGLLAWCIAQTGRVQTLFDARWIGSLLRETLDGVASLIGESDAQRPAATQEAIAHDDLDTIRGNALVDAGATVLRLLRDQAARAPQTAPGELVAHVIAEPLLALDVSALERAFPGCRVIVLERSLAAVTDAFARHRSADGEHLQPAALADLWQRCSAASRAASAALGTERALTVDFDTLLATPGATMARVLSWLGLEPDARTTRPLVGMTPEVGASQLSNALTPEVRTASRRDATQTSTDAKAASSPSTETTAVLTDRESIWRRYLDETVLSEGSRAPLAARVRAAAQRIIPQGARVAVVSRGDDALTAMAGRTAAHFPSDRDGAWLGYHPGDDAEALRLLDDAIDRGAQWLVVPATSLWWLEHYTALGERLTSDARLALFDPDLAAIFELGGTTGRADAAIPGAEPATPSADALMPDAAQAATPDTGDADMIEPRAQIDELARLLATGDSRCRAIALAVSETADGATTAAERTWSERIESLRDRLNASEEPISIALPSKRKVEKLDAIGAVCRLRSKRPVWGSVLMKLVRRLRPVHVVELGSCMGISTAYQAAGLAIAGSGSIVTLEGAPALAELTARNLAALELDRVEVVQGLFVDTLLGVLDALPRIDFAFIDGHHDEHATLRYFEQMLPKASPGSVFAFDDIRWSDGMRRAWGALCEHDAVTTSIDLGVIGICIVYGDRRHGHFAPGAPRQQEEPARSLAAMIDPPLGAEARVLVVSRGDDRLLELGAARGLHFPQDATGAWIGYHPADSDEADRMLAEAIGGGATHLLVPGESLWWLEFYDAFARGIDERHALVARTEHYVLYRLTPEEKPSTLSLHETLDQEQE